MTPILLLLAACAAENTNPDAQAGPVDEFQATFADLEAKTAAHSQAVAGMTDTEAIVDEEAAFWDMCQGLRDQAISCWDRMKECGNGMGGMMGGEEDDWDTWMHDMWTAMGDHHYEMGHCSDTAECHDIETGWHDDMSEMFDHMHGMGSDWPEDCDW